MSITGTKRKLSESDIKSIAMVCHEASRKWSELYGEPQKPWIEAEPWQQDSAIKGVIFRLNNPDAGHDAQHKAWMKEKLDNGWSWGAMKDGDKKIHPHLVPFNELPEYQKKIDILFCAIVDALK